MKYSKIILFMVVVVMSLSSCAKIKQIFSGTANIGKGLTYDAQYHKALEYYDKKRYDKAMALFNNIQQFYAGNSKIDTIMFYTANCFYFNRDFITSSDLYDQYRTQMGRSTFASQADLYHALSLYYISPDIQMDQTFTNRAILAFEDFIYRNPNHDMEQQCRSYIAELYQRVYQSQVSVARSYFDLGHYKSAIVSLENILKKNPQTPHREEILYFLVWSNYEYARSSIPAKRKERFYNTIDAYYKFITEYPESKHLKDVKKYHSHAKNISEGAAYVNEVTGAVVYKRLDIYGQRDKLQQKVDRLEKKNKGGKALEKAKSELSIIERAIAKHEEALENRKREVEMTITR